MTDINQIAYLATGWIGQPLLEDNIWKSFGFRSRPKRGKFFDFLVSKKKLGIEKFLVKEMLALSLIDIAQAAKPLDSYVKDDCDFRILLLAGVISNTFTLGLCHNLDDFLDTIKEVNRYTNNSTDNKIPQSFVARLTRQVALDDRKKVFIMYGAANLLASCNKENGLLGINDTYRVQLKQHNPTGKLSCELTKAEVDKIIWVALELVNN